MQIGAKHRYSRERHGTRFASPVLTRTHSPPDWRVDPPKASGPIRLLKVAEPPYTHVGCTVQKRVSAPGIKHRPSTSASIRGARFSCL